MTSPGIGKWRKIQITTRWRLPITVFLPSLAASGETMAVTHDVKDVRNHDNRDSGRNNGKRHLVIRI